MLIPKPGTADEQRPLSIPAVRDRIVQAAVKIVLEPVFEADFAAVLASGSARSAVAHDALQVLMDESWRGRRWVVETDIANCFSAIPHEQLMQAVEERVCDQSVLKLLRAMLRAGVMEDGQVRRAVTGTAARRRGLSPLLCNVYLHRIDRVWDVREHGVLVRYADDAAGDVQVPCSRPRPRWRGSGNCWPSSGWSRRKPRPGIVHLEVGGPRVRLPRLPPPAGARPGAVAGGKRVTFLARWPADKAMQHARDRIRELTARSPAAAAGRGDRGGPQPVPARLGRVLPVRQLRPPASAKIRQLRAGCGWRW